jgi:transposase
MFPDLVRATAENFRIGDVLADKAYQSRKNMELVEEAGGTAYIPFRNGTRPDKNGPTWERLFHAFAFHRDDFLRHYHQRSNVESAFSMIKRKFGDSIRSKTPTAMANEVLAKLVCHNLVVVVHGMYELGIAPEYATRDDEPSMVIPFPGVGERRAT